MISDAFSAPVSLRGFFVIKSLIRSSVALALCSVAVAHANLLPIQKWQTSQGATVLLVESHGLPMLDVRVDFDAGSRRDPGGKDGLAESAFGLMTMGAAGHSETEIGELEADLGAQLGSHVEEDGAGLNLRTLTDPPVLDKALALLSDVLAHPDYPDAVVARERQRGLAELEQAKSQVDAVLYDHFNHLLYGDHPYGHGIAQQELGLQAITRDDLVHFHHDYVVANHAVISIVGDVTRAQAQQLVDKLLAALPASGPDLPPLPPVQFNKPGTEEKLPFPTSQAHVIVGSPFIARSDPDWFALQVGNHILGGGGFSSRLTKVVRDQNGLAYSVYSGLDPRFQEGPFEAALQTRKEEADHALTLVRKVIADFVAKGPTATEVREAQQDMMNGLALSLDTNQKWLSFLGRIGRYNLPADFLDTYAEHVRAVTPEQIRVAFQKHLHPESLVTVVVGTPTLAMKTDAAK